MGEPNIGNGISSSHMTHYAGGNGPQTVPHSLVLMSDHTDMRRPKICLLATGQTPLLLVSEIGQNLASLAPL